ncbi:metabotropic glutamate receptor 8 [Trichonephila clavipes]|nr:metabotropic glutamate receptor 8 [Trichonephila clavipes]
MESDVQPHSFKSCLSPAKGIPKVHFHFDISTPVVKGDLIPDHLRLLALEIIDGISSDVIKIYTDGSRLSDRAEHDLEAVLNEQNFGDLWIFSDSRSSLQHLYNWITVGDKAGVSILQKLTQISESHDVHFQWIPSHVNIFRKEQADLLDKEGCNASPPISSTLAYSEH